MAQQSIVLQREGRFSVRHTGSNANQCGPLGSTVLEYHVRITADETVLTSQGFLIDNFRIQNYFVETFGNVEEFKSCERIAIQARNDFIKMFVEGEELRKVRLLALNVAISGTPGAWLMAKWSR